MIGSEQICVDDPRTPDVRALLERHLTFALSTTPPEHSFALDVDGLRENPGYIAFARENGTVYHTYTVTAPDPFVAPYFSFLLDRTPTPQPDEPLNYRKDEYPD